MPEQPINLGGKHKHEHAETPKTTNASQYSEVPAEFLDNEFPVPTDQISLPSEGLFYPNKKSVVSFKYLTAEDENILTSPELIRNGRVLDVLLESAIIDKDLRPDVMLTGDRNAVLLALRETGYGDDYEVKMNCPECSAEYKTSVKLSSLKQKKLEVTPDNNGEFDIQLPKMKLNLKFRLLNGRDETYLTKKAEQTKKTKTNAQFSTLLTERYLLQIMEVNGNRDKIYIKRAISSFPISDSLFLRSYISEIEPGVNMEHEFECTECGHVYLDQTPINSRLFWPNSTL